ncbi:MAG: tRNA epoxyqueuosine(34) reductase QueG [Bacteroidales bacterium]|jgi:epoxyqueuosine reductase|nr:tRNA epoxyqueuosine(34) reductase QueG [Bacteroidales bacterium]
MISKSAKIEKKALELGFSAIGFSRAEFLEKESRQLKRWLDNGFHGNMQYMENHFEKRVDPTKLVEGAKSVISVLYNYYPNHRQREDTYQISKYAYGRDYHDVVKEKLFLLFEFIRTTFGKVDGRVFVDSAPVMDKVWAARSGLGWIGKNTNFISKELGSFVFIGELILDLELEVASTPGKDYCGHCTRCIDACPTQALRPYRLDARKCISYLTIENKGEIPSVFKEKWDAWIFGCDICQDVCPWNRKAKPHAEPRFKLSEVLKNLEKEEWKSLDKESFTKLFKGTAVERTKFKGLKRNIEFQQKKPLTKSKGLDS